MIQYDHLEKYIVPEQIIMESTELKELKQGQQLRSKKSRHLSSGGSWQRGVRLIIQ